MVNNYRVANKNIWQGRVDNSKDFASFRWHQVICNINLSNLGETKIDINKKNYCLLGYECNEGVIRNLGRTGTEKAPDYLRKEMANLAWNNNSNVELYDAGNIFCLNNNLETAQQALSEAVEKILSLGMFPIIMGGGHDIAFGNYNGVAGFVYKRQKEKRIGIINFDAHFDLRPYKNMKGSSGTMFLQIADMCKKNNNAFSYHCVGIQTYANTKRLFQTAKELNVNFELAKNINESNLADIKSNLNKFISQNDHIYLTICSDVFSSAYAPGVSSPQPFGLLPEISLELIKYVAASNKLVSFDIAEISPRFDEDNRTAKLGAIIIYALINTLSGNHLG
ncbi:MAG: formimidoylglutamase [Bacteroidetes bacterium 4572_117]|nr:MAG: formimidoylglutamase [Bacteroidetes bacterium 4572_117]